MAENQVIESGSSSEETETDEEWSDPAIESERTRKDTVKRKRKGKKDKRVCDDGRGSSAWKGLVLGLRLVAQVVLELTFGSFYPVAAIGPELRNRCRDRIIRENAARGDTTATDSGKAAFDHQDKRARTEKKKEQEEKEEKEVRICNIL